SNSTLRVSFLVGRGVVGGSVWVAWGRRCLCLLAGGLFVVSEGSGCSAFSACRCAGLVECGECLFPVERLGAGCAADDMDEGGAWEARAVGQVLDCPGRLAFARRSTACLGRTAGGHVFVGDARDGACVCRAHPGSVLDRFHTAIGGVLPYEDSHLVS